MEEWKEVLGTPEMLRLLSEIENSVSGQKVCPSREKWFRWAELTPLSKVRVVIIGQDPYHTAGIADGLAFSSGRQDYLPPSLRNIFGCLEKNGLCQGSKKETCLDSWARQGVLLLNTAFSVEEGKPKSHSPLWRIFFNQILKRIIELHSGPCLPIFAWGNDARSSVQRALSNAKHLEQKIRLMFHCHPSPYNGTRFLSCSHFNDLNQYFVSNGEQPILWGSIGGSHSQLDIEKTIKIFTDGSSLNGDIGSASLFVSGPLASRAILSRAKGTNIRAEGIAILNALEKVLEDDEKTDIQIYTDSEFWIKMIDVYMPNWSKEKFSRQANSDLTRALHDTARQIRENRSLELIHVPSHGKKNVAQLRPFEYKNNSIVDELANRARLTLKEGSKVLIEM
jgi:uracil-DNA glycosylase